MNYEFQTELKNTFIRQNARRTELFRARIGRFDADADQKTMDELTHWVEAQYAADLKQRPSKHVYIQTLPAEITQKIDLLRDNPVIHNAILEQFDADCVITPMKHTDELYISHYNQDNGGDQGLFHKHYDGNLRIISFGAVVRALIYLQSDASYKVVFGDSKIEKAFTTYDFGLLDFHRELHWVEGEYKPDDQQRILLKCNYLICPRDANFFKRAVLGANTAVFYIVKAAMEYSKSPRTLPQYFIGYLCNIFRVMNNVHPIVPLIFILSVLTLIGWGIYQILM